jgi:translation initiation factor IF-3
MSSAGAASQMEEEEEEEEEEHEEEEDEEENDEDDEEDLLAEMKRYQGSKLAITNDEILFPTINYIDENGKYHTDVDTDHLVARMKRSRKSATPLILVLVAPKQRTARVFTAREFRAHLARAKLSGKENKLSVKSVQLTWNISDSDLEYRLKRGVDDLKKGHRLDIMIGARKAKLMREHDERVVMLDKIRKMFEPYGYEWNKMSGGFPNAELWFQGYTEKEKADMAQKRGEAPTTVLGEEEEVTPRPWEEEGLQEGKAEEARQAHFMKINKAYKKLLPERMDVAGGYWTSMTQEGTITIPEAEEASLSEKEQQKREREKKVKEKAQKIAERKKKEREAKKAAEEGLKGLEGATKKKDAEEAAAKKAEEDEARRKLTAMAQNIGGKKKGKNGGIGIAVVKDTWGKYDVTKDKRFGKEGIY